MRCSGFILAMLIVTGTAMADSLTHNGKTYSEVYVREGGTSYYVQDPSTGSVKAVPKSEIAPGGVTISTDAAHRQALLDKWKAAKGDAAPMAALTSMPQAPTPAAPPRADGKVSIKVKNVPLRQALKLTLRSQNLDYRVQDNYIYVSTPQVLRQEPLELIEPRLYSLSGIAASDTLPKIVVRNPGGAYPQMGYGGGMGGYSGGGMGAYGMGGGTAMRGGGMGMGGMGMGGMGMGGMGGMGMGGMGRMGGGMGMGMGGGQHFSNISDLFGTIDDRLVGETPAVIGIGGLSTVQRPTQR